MLVYRVATSTLRTNSNYFFFPLVGPVYAEVVIIIVDKEEKLITPFAAFGILRSSRRSFRNLPVLRTISDTGRRKEVPRVGLRVGGFFRDLTLIPRYPIFRKCRLTVQVPSIRFVGMTGAKGSTASSTSTISRATRVSHVPIQRRGPTSREGVCENDSLEMASLSRGECYFNNSRLPVIPVPGKNERDAWTPGGDANEILALLHGPCHIRFPFREAARSLRLPPFADTLKQYIDFSAPPRAGPPALRELYVLENA